ncbi:MAG: DUF4173 domain-containing protein [Clostridiales bacterium]|nr:DUF4173 domain-containing protein [Candidatus Equinaster intestinalis]
MNEETLNSNNPETPKTPVVPVTPKPQKMPLTLKDRIFALVILIYSVLWIDFSLFSSFNLGFTVSTALFFVITLIYFIEKGIKLKVYPIACGILSVLFSVTLTLYDNSFDGFLGFLLVMVLNAFYLTQITDCNTFGNGTFRTVGDVVLNYFITPFAYLGVAIGSLFAKDEEKKNNRSKGIIIGILLAVPVIAVVVPLLVESNPFFEHLLDSVFDSFGEFIAKLILGVALFFPLFTMVFAYKKGLPREMRKEPKESGGHIDSVIVGSFLSVISVVYVIYILTQIAYFFSAFKGILPEGYEFTVAEYARKGFFEMCVVAAINLGLVFLSTLLIRKKEDGNLPAFPKWLNCFICLFTILLIATAISKMVLYITSFGMTRLRIVTSCFMIFLSVVFVLAIIRIFKKDFKYMKGVICALCAVALIMGFCDVDTTIARYNYNAYKNKTLSSIDVKTLGELSDASVPYLAELLKDDDVQVRNAAHNALVDKLFEHYNITCEKHGSDCERTWQNYYYWRDGSTDFDGDICDNSPLCSKAVKAELKEADKFDIRSYNTTTRKAVKILGELSDELLVNYYKY